MISSITAILFILNEKKEIISNKILQKGQAASRTNGSDHQIFNYTTFVPLSHSSSNDAATNAENQDSDNEHVQVFEQHGVYLVTGKFAWTASGSLELAVTNSQRLHFDGETVPEGRPFVHLLGRTEDAPTRRPEGYRTVLQVKPYISKDQYDTFSVILIHPLNGRFKNALEKTRRFSLVHVMGVLLVHEDTLYCEILEYQFVSTKAEQDTHVTVPWKSNSTVQAREQTATKSSFEKRIIALHENPHGNSSPSVSENRPKRDSTGKGKSVSVANLSVELLNNKQNLENNNNTAIDLDDPTDDSYNEEVQDHAELALARKRPKRRTRTTKKD
jgi:hypothetical protein